MVKLWRQLLTTAKAVLMFRRRITSTNSDKYQQPRRTGAKNWKILSIILLFKLRLERKFKRNAFRHGSIDRQVLLVEEESLCNTTSNANIDHSPTMIAKVKIDNYVANGQAQKDMSRRKFNSMSTLAFDNPTFDAIEMRSRSESALPCTESQVNIEHIPHSPSTSPDTFIEERKQSLVYTFVIKHYKRSKYLGPASVFVCFMLLVMVLTGFALIEYEARVDSCRQNSTVVAECRSLLRGLLPQESPSIDIDFEHNLHNSDNEQLLHNEAQQVIVTDAK